MSGRAPGRARAFPPFRRRGCSPRIGRHAPGMPRSPVRSPLLQESRPPHASCCSCLESGNRKLGSWNFLPKVPQTTCRKNVSRSEQQPGFRSLSLWFRPPLPMARAAAALPGRPDAGQVKTLARACPVVARRNGFPSAAGENGTPISSELAAGGKPPHRPNADRGFLDL